MQKLDNETLCVQAGWSPKKGEPRILPIYQSTTFKYDTSAQMADLFDLKADGYFYTRLQNPTNDAVAQKITELEGGIAGMLTSSGQAANFSPSSTSANRATILSAPRQFMAEPTISLPSP